MSRRNRRRVDPRYIHNRAGRVLVDGAGRPLRRRSYDRDPRDRFGTGGDRYGPYEAANWNRRTWGWPTITGDDPSIATYVLWRLRQQSRDLVRNNEHAESAVSTIVDHVIGEGIVSASQDPRWKRWANTTACDSEKQLTFAGIQALCQETVVQSGEVLVRRRWRRQTEKLPLPFQLQVMEPDHLVTSYDREMKNGHRVLHGIEFDKRGRRVAYYLYRNHPGSRFSNQGQGELKGSTFGDYVRVPARDIAHVYVKRRAGQVRGVPWMAPIMFRLRNFDEYDDATLEKQKIASMLAGIYTDPQGDLPGPGVEDDSTTGDADDDDVSLLEPGILLKAPTGRDVKFYDPPTNADYPAYTNVNLRRIASGIGVAYEDMTGDYGKMAFSAARMSRLRHWKRVKRWRKEMIFPMLLQPVWQWAYEASLLQGEPLEDMTEWTSPGMEAINPETEILAASRRILAGMSTPDEEIRAQGKDPAQHWQEYAESWARLDALGIKLASDPRRDDMQANAASLRNAGAVDGELGDVLRQILERLDRLDRDDD